MTNVVAYEAPEWAQDIKLIPKRRLKLAHLPTPIEPWPLKDTLNDAAFYIKRDDFTGTEFCGNKIRKLEFLLEDALSGGYTCVITVGGIQSNHCRATAIVAARLGLECYLLLRHNVTEIPPEQSLEGNLLLSRLCGAHIRLFTVKQRDEMGGYEPIIRKLELELIQLGKKPYVIPIGGSNALGTWGYLEATQEIITQIKQQQLIIDDIVISLGSGGTLAGLALGNYLAKTSIRVHGICACDDAKYFHNEINKIYKDLGLPYKSESLCNIIEGYVGPGYGKNIDKDFKILSKIARETGVILDSVYTLKAVKAMMEIKELSNHRVLFIHTGGLFGLYSSVPLLHPHLISTVKPLYTNSCL